jgi:hypothetical protein
MRFPLEVILRWNTCVKSAARFIAMFFLTLVDAHRIKNGLTYITPLAHYLVNIDAVVS